MAGFFRENDFAGGSFSKLKTFVDRQFSGIDLAEVNLEALVTYLELSTDTLGLFGDYPSPDDVQARRELDELVRKRLSIPKLRGCAEHKKILTKAIAGPDSHDSIITLNYDLIVDNTLYELSPKEANGKQLVHGCLLDRMYALLGKTMLIHGERGSLYHGHKDLGFYLKLHGSIDWLHCPDADCGNHQLYFPNWLGSDLVHNEPGDPCSLCGSPLASVILPPAMYKSLVMFPKLRLLWNLAYRVLSRADRIVVFGVSFAPSDYYLRWLLKKAMRTRQTTPIIYDIDENGSPSAKIKEITGMTPIHKKNVDEFLKEKESDSGTG